MNKIAEGLKQFTKEILVSALAMAMLAEIISLFVIGLSGLFALGLAVGTVVAAIGFILLVKTGEAMTATQSGVLVVIGYFFRLILYGVSFFICIRISLQCAFGCGCGFVTVHLGILFLYGIVYKFFRKDRVNPLNDWTEPKEWNDLSQYDEEDDDWNDK